MSDETETTTEFQRVLTREEAVEANYDAHEDFLGRLHTHGRRDLVSDALMDRWYDSRPQRARQTAILNDYGPAVSTLLTTSDRSDG